MNNLKQKIILLMIGILFGGGASVGLAVAWPGLDWAKDGQSISADYLTSSLQYLYDKVENISVGGGDGYFENINITGDISAPNNIFRCAVRDVEHCPAGEYMSGASMIRKRINHIHCCRL